MRRFARRRAGPRDESSLRAGGDYFAAAGKWWKASARTEFATPLYCRTPEATPRRRRGRGARSVRRSSLDGGASLPAVWVLACRRRRGAACALRQLQATNVGQRYGSAVPQGARGAERVFRDKLGSTAVVQALGQKGRACRDGEAADLSDAVGPPAAVRAAIMEEAVARAFPGRPGYAVCSVRVFQLRHVDRYRPW